MSYGVVPTDAMGQVTLSVPLAASLPSGINNFEEYRVFLHGLPTLETRQKSLRDIVSLWSGEVERREAEGAFLEDLAQELELGGELEDEYWSKVREMAKKYRTTEEEWNAY